MLVYLKILNQGKDGDDFPEKIKKESKEISMNNELSAVKSKGYSVLS